MGNEFESQAQGPIPGLHMTPATRALLGPAAGPLSRATPPGSSVLLTGPRDFNEDGTAGWRLRDVFSGAGLGVDTPGIRARRGIEELLGQASGSTGISLPPRDNPGLNGVCLVTLPMDGRTITTPRGPVAIGTPQGFGEGMLELRPGALANERLPGTAHDMLLWVGGHELDHCRGIERHGEYFADIEANRHYRAALASGGTQNPELPYFMRGTRAAATMLHVDGEDYRLGGIVPINGEPPLSVTDLNRARNDIGDMRSAVYERIGRDMGLHDDPVMRLRAYDSLRYSSNPLNVSEQNQQRINTILESNNPQQAREFLNRNPVPASHREDFNSSLSTLSGYEARARLSEPDNANLRPQMVYETTRRMLAEGALNQYPQGRQVAERFVDFAERYGHNAFNVDPANRRTASPDIDPPRMPELPANRPRATNRPRR